MLFNSCVFIFSSCRPNWRLCAVANVVVASKASDPGSVLVKKRSSDAGLIGDDDDRLAQLIDHEARQLENFRRKRIDPDNSSFGLRSAPAYPVYGATGLSSAFSQSHARLISVCKLNASGLKGATKLLGGIGATTQKAVDCF